MVKNKFSFVMPMVVNHRNNSDGSSDLDRFVKIQLPTFRKFLKIEDLHKFYIVSPKKDLEIIEKRLSAEFPEFPYEYVDELELLPQLKTFPLNQVTVHPGWMIQIMSKVSIADRIETEHYMTFETDLFLTKPFGYENLFNDDGKLICSHFTEFENCPTKDKWHLHATALLFKGEIDSFNLHKDNKNEIVDGELKINKVMGVSPNFFITKEMMNVRNWLEENYKDTIKQIGEDANYMDLLIRCTNGHPETWVEYTLYWMWLYKIGKMDEYYSFKEPYVCWNELFTFNYRQGYGDKYFGEFDTHIMKNPQHYFNLVQSNLTHLKIEDIVDKIKPHLED